MLVIESGEKPAQGRRVDLISVKRRIDDGDLVDDIENDENYFGTVVKHRKFFEQYERKIRRKHMHDDYNGVQYRVRSTAGRSKRTNPPGHAPTYM